MTLYASQFARGAAPLGSVIQGFGIDPALYERLDGRTITRTARPRLSTIFPIGKHTGTVRTLAQSGGGTGIPGVIVTADHFIASSGQTAQSVQYSTDGVSWSTASTPSSSINAGMIATPSRLIMLNGNTGAQPIATANLNPAGTWTATTSGPAAAPVGNYLSKMAYSPTLATVLAAATTASTTRHSLADGATAWVSRTSASGMGAAVGVCWTGTRFVLIAANSQTCEYTTDAATYTAALLAEATAASQGNIVSDGAGTVVVSGCASGLQVSHDHGATWQIRQIPGVPPSDTWRVQRAGNRFVVPTAQGLAFSEDGDAWHLETTPVQAMVVAAGVGKKGNTTLQVFNSTTAYSFTESATEFQLPNLRQATPAASGSPIPLPAYFIRAV
jgi:hypothetical protein